MINKSEVEDLVKLAILSARASDILSSSDGFSTCKKEYMDAVSDFLVTLHLRGSEIACQTFSHDKKDAKIKRSLVLQTIGGMLATLPAWRETSAAEKPRTINKSGSNSDLCKNTPTTDLVTCAAALKYALNLYADEKPKQGENNGEED